MEEEKEGESVAVLKHAVDSIAATCGSSKQGRMYCRVNRKGIFGGRVLKLRNLCDELLE